VPIWQALRGKLAAKRHEKIIGFGQVAWNVVLSDDIKIEDFTFSQKTSNFMTCIKAKRGAAC